MPQWAPDETLRFWLEQVVRVRLALIAVGLVLLGTALTAYAAVGIVRGRRRRRQYPDWPGTTVPTRVRTAGRWGLGLLTLAGVIGLVAWPVVTRYQALNPRGTAAVGSLHVRPGPDRTWTVRLESEVPSLSSLERGGPGTRWFIVGAFLECPPAVRWLLLPSMHRPLWIGIQPRFDALLPRDVESLSRPLLDPTFRLIRRTGLCRTYVHASVPMETRPGTFLIVATPRGYVLIGTGRRPTSR